MIRGGTILWLSISTLLTAGLLGLVLLTDDVGSSSGGIVGKTESGCTCHSPTSSVEVTPTIDGLPSTYQPGRVYLLDLSYSGPPPSGGNAQAGFNLRVEEGTLITSPGDTSVRIDISGKEATQSSTGNRQTTWKVQWEAPEEVGGDIDVTLVVNVVNGDGSPGQGDKWGRTRTTVQEEGGDNTLVLVAVLVLLAILAAFLVLRRRPSGTRKRPRRKGGKRRDRQGGRRRRKR